ncbi:hypothetical protein AG0111_0g12064 [Alternaria gaisen]|uniref:Uncharacterized protein n=1 Tax=Alternaria gaisen TaxID=167740 RepID=A0ACB6F5M5_9PLEO|nr:hypothetical protein AG0111_0g12064 [Alternaria gaisen]
MLFNNTAAVALLAGVTSAQMSMPSAGMDPSMRMTTSAMDSSMPMSNSAIKSEIAVSTPTTAKIQASTTSKTSPIKTLEPTASTTPSSMNASNNAAYDCANPTVGLAAGVGFMFLAAFG